MAGASRAESQRGRVEAGETSVAHQASLADAASGPRNLSARMGRPALARRATTEALGTGFLVAAVVGSGIMAERLAGGNVGLALLANTVATGAVLVALILALGPLSGAHFNPVVTLAAGCERRPPVAGRPGVHRRPRCWEASSGRRSPTSCSRARSSRCRDTPEPGRRSSSARPSRRLDCSSSSARVPEDDPSATPFAVAAYITAAYWFTASTSFANPAVTLARAVSDSFAGIRPQDVPGFIGAQCLGGALAIGVVRWLLPRSSLPDPEA